MTDRQTCTDAYRTVSSVFWVEDSLFYVPLLVVLPILSVQHRLRLPPNCCYFTNFIFCFRMYIISSIRTYSVRDSCCFFRAALLPFCLETPFFVYRTRMTRSNNTRQVVGPGKRGVVFVRVAWCDVWGSALATLQRSASDGDNRPTDARWAIRDSVICICVFIIW